MFNELFSGSPKFTYNSDNNIYVGVNEFLKDHDKQITYQVKGMFVTKGGQYGPRGIIIIDGYNIYAPAHMVEKINTIRSNPDMVNAINAGLCGIRFRDYEDKKRAGVIRTTIDIVDYAPVAGDLPIEIK